MAMMTFVGCSSRTELPDWTLPVPEGTRVVEHEVLSLDERTGPPIVIEEDLILGSGRVDPDLTFYGMPYFAVGDDGRVYVMDLGNDRVVVFGAEGEHVMTLGREGQGPGEFQFGVTGSITVTEDRLRIEDRRNNRLSIWSVQGEFLESRPAPGSAQFRVHWFQGLPDGRRVAFVTVMHEDRSQTEVATILDDDNEEVLRLGARREFPDLPSKRHDYELGIFAPSLRPTTTRDGRIYLRDGEQYQILALDSWAKAEWALRVDWEPNPYPDSYKEWIVGLRRESPRLKDLQVSDFDWPERAPALRGIMVDGHGHLYVIPLSFPLIRDEYPVDVFSRDGELLYSGTLVGDWWSAALGDQVYGTREDAAGDHVVVRSRLVEPFSP